jgi:SpoVK/Ycf46/Vps4 family AAA+-type ATPase
VAREDGDCVIFFDEIDAFMRKRTDREDETTRRLKCEMLHQLDNLESCGNHVVVVAATNRPFDLDEAVVRVANDQSIARRLTQ